MFGTPAAAGAPPQQYNYFDNNQNNQQVPWWYRELSAIHNSYEPGQSCKFQSMMFEVLGVAPDLLIHGAHLPGHLSHVKAARRKEILQSNPWIDQREWQRAEDANPDPVNWIPTPMVGISALHERVEQQAIYVRRQLDMLNTNGGESWLNLNIGDDLKEQIQQCRHDHARLKQRLIKVLGRLERLQCLELNSARSKPEIEFAERLQVLQKKIDDPRGAKSHITQIATELELEDQSASHSLSTELNKTSQAMQEQEQQAIFNFLELQREGIEGLMNIVKRDIRDLEIIKKNPNF